MSRVCSPLQTRANVRRTQAQVLLKQADEQRRGVQFMRTHKMAGWESANNKAEGYSQAAAEMELQAKCDETESMEAGAKARAAAECAQSASLEAHLHARMERSANTDYSIVETATVSCMDYENRALHEVRVYILKIKGFHY